MTPAPYSLRVQLVRELAARGWPAPRIAQAQARRPAVGDFFSGWITDYHWHPIPVGPTMARMKPPMPHPSPLCHRCATRAPTMRDSDTVDTHAARTAWILLRPSGRLTCPACAPDAIRALAPEDRAEQARLLAIHCETARRHGHIAVIALHALLTVATGASS